MKSVYAFICLDTDCSFLLEFPQNTAALELLAIKIHFVKRGFFQSILRSLVEIARLILTVSYLKVKYLRKKVNKWILLKDHFGNI